MARFSNLFFQQLAKWFSNLTGVKFIFSSISFKISFRFPEVLRITFKCLLKSRTLDVHLDVVGNFKPLTIHLDNCKR